MLQVAIVLETLLLGAFALNQTAPKNQTITLSILSLNMFTGYEPRDNKLCKAAQQMVIDNVNNRTDFLNGFHLHLDFRDEGSAGDLATKEAISYIRRVGEVEGNIMLAPLTMGPFLTAGCKSWGQTVHHFNMVALGSSCTPPSLTARRDLYPNMYRTRSPAELHLYGRIQFFKKMTSWKRIAILMHVSENPYNYETASLFLNLATANGFEVAAFDAKPFYDDEVMASYKQRDIRIFTFEAAEPSACFSFLCQAYQAGITGSKYFFVLQYYCFISPMFGEEKISPGCTRTIVIEQLKYTLYIGTGNEANGRELSTDRTTLGHTVREFETLFDRYTRGQRTPDYDFRHLCYDRALHAVVILDNAEKKLQRVGLSLKDYRDFPLEVMAATNRSAAEVDFKTLRHGRFHYSERLEFDYASQIVIRWSPSKGEELLSKVAGKENASVLNVDSYYITHIQKTTYSFPRDRAFVELVVLEVPYAIFGAVSAICTVLVAVKVMTAVHVIQTWKNLRLPVSKVIFIFGSIFLDISATTFATPKWLTNTTVCNITAVMATIGISVLHSLGGFVLYLSFRNLPTKVPAKVETALARLSKQPRYQMRISHQIASCSPPNGQCSFSSVALPSLEIPLTDRQTSIPCCGFCFVNFVLLIVWFLVDPVRFITETLLKKPVYHHDTDTYVTYSASFCKSEHITQWVLALCCFNLVPLLFGLYATLKLRHNHIAPCYRELKNFQVGVTCLVTFFIVGFIAVFITSSPVTRQIIAAFVATTYSTMAVCAIFHADLKFFIVKTLTKIRNRL